MTQDTEALIAKAESYIAATFDNSAHEARMLSELIAALRAADERERELYERAAVLFGNCFDYGAQCQKARSFLIFTPRGAEDARSHIVKKAVQALRGKS